MTATIESEFAATVRYCVQCGYDLRGALPEGACPECAAPVAKTADALAYGYGPHSAAQARGAGLIALAWPLTIILSITIAAMTLDHPQLEWLCLQLGLGVLPPLLWLAGVWLFTRRPPPGLDRAPLLRRATRWSFFALLPLLWLSLAATTIVDALRTQEGAMPRRPTLADTASDLQRRFEGPLELAAWLAVAALPLLFWYSATLPFLAWRFRLLGLTLAALVVYPFAFFGWHEYSGAGGLGGLFGEKWWEQVLFGVAAAAVLLLVGLGGVYWFRLWIGTWRMARRMAAPARRA